MARYRLIDPVYDHGFLGDVMLTSTVVDGCWVGVAEVDEIPANLPARVRVEELEPADDQTDLDALIVPELQAKARDLGINVSGLRKAELIDAIKKAQ